jgi:hypothetical protein
VGLMMVGTGIVMAWGWKNMAQRERDKYLP